jgi:RimJ/RimL family protein N-acetyltransferase
VALTVRPMQLEEVSVVIDYFHGASAEQLETLGVDPTRLPEPTKWRQLYEHEFAQPVDRRRGFMVLWELEGRTIGFSTVDKLKYGNEAYMHLHVVDPGLPQAGHGSACVRRSVDIYFETLELQRLYCEPNAFNTAPNRALQKAGFRYVKTHMTVPGPLNFHQAVTRWVVERESVDGQ